MSKSIYIDTHASVSRPHTRKPYNHPWWRQCYRRYERSIDSLRDHYPLVYYMVCAGLVIAGWFMASVLVAMFA